MPLKTTYYERWDGLVATDGISNSVTSLTPDHHFQRLRRVIGWVAGIIGSIRAGQQPLSTLISHAAAIILFSVRLTQSLACEAAGGIMSIIGVRIFAIHL